jgi:hypothetical protein
MNTERFVHDQNLQRFRRLASGATTEAERKGLFDLLAEEQVKFIELQKLEDPVVLIGTAASRSSLSS